MPFDASVFKVMIASPSDVPAERTAIREIITEWNHVHAEDRRQVLLPVGWETHSTPTMGDRPQGIINKQVLANCDLLVAVFWTRLGSATGAAKSGTVEEIEEHLKAGKPAMIYFSNCPVHPGSIDDKQYKALTKFKEECFRRGIVHAYETPEQFREDFRRQLTQKIIQNFPQRASPNAIGDEATPTLAPLAVEILTAAAENKCPVQFVTHDGGAAVLVGMKQFDSGIDLELAAQYQEAVESLAANDLIREKDRDFYDVTRKGYRFIRDPQRSADPRFAEAVKQMPDLIQAMKEDLTSDDGQLVREFFVMKKTHVLGGSKKPRFIYYEEDVPNLRGKLDVLENLGYLTDVTPGNAPIYRMSEEFVKLVLSS